MVVKNPRTGEDVVPPAPRSTMLPSAPPDPELVKAAAEEEQRLAAQALADLGVTDPDEIPAAAKTGDEEAVIAKQVEPPLGPARTAEEEEALKERVAAYRTQHPYLTDDDINETLGLAEAQVMQARREAAIKDLIRKEKARLRIEEGLVTGISVLDELCEVTIDCQPWQSPIVLNGVGYYEGQKYKVPRHVLNMILEMCDRGRRSDRDIHGESWDSYYRKPHNTEFSAVKGVVKGALDPRVAA